MLHRIKELMGYVLSAADGEIGRCKDFLFDDQHWTVRYMVADTGRWLPGRKVVLSPISLDKPDPDHRRISVKLTRKQIEGSPPLAEHLPVSREYEARYFQHYGWPFYWVGGDLWGPEPYPEPLFQTRAEPVPSGEQEPKEPHLRSVKEVTGYHIQALDGEIGHLGEFLLDDEQWLIRYLILDTRNWLPGRDVCVVPGAVEWIDWENRKVGLGLTRSQIENSPPFDPVDHMTREYEVVLHDYYGWPRYWE